jgi:hypothetical protein
MLGRSQYYAFLAYAVTSSILAVVRSERGHRCSIQADTTSKTEAAAPSVCTATTASVRTPDGAGAAPVVDPRSVQFRSSPVPAVRRLR